MDTVYSVQNLIYNYAEVSLLVLNAIYVHCTVYSVQNLIYNYVEASLLVLNAIYVQCTESNI